MEKEKLVQRGYFVSKDAHTMMRLLCMKAGTTQSKYLESLLRKTYKDEFGTDVPLTEKPNVEGAK